jgi:lipoprotein-releasing system permease protein
MIRFAYSMALRSLRHRPGLLVLTMGIVAVSVTLIISLSTLMGGVKKRILSAVTESMPHISIQPEERSPYASWNIPSLQRPGRVYIGKKVKLVQTKKKIEEWKQWFSRLRQFDPQVLSVTAVASEQAILFRGEQPRTVHVLGVSPKEYNRVVNIQKKLVRGSFLRMNTGQMVVGQTMAEELALSPGDKVRLTSATGNVAMYTVIGMFFTGSRIADQSRVYIPIRDAQSLFGLGQAVTSLEIKVKDIFQAEQLGQQLQYRLPYKVSSWMGDNENLLAAIQTQDMTVNIILLLTTIASGFGIASILIMAVVGKLREIGILIAMGATRVQLILTYTFQGLLISCMGAFLGIATGVGLTHFLLSIREKDSLGREVPMFAVELQFDIILLAFLVAMTVGLFASIVPAWRASRVNPIEIIRGM